MSDSQHRSLAQRFVAELVGTAFLLATVVGSGIMAETLAGGNVAIALLANTIATGAGLVALILAFGAVSGAHFNPAVTLADATQGGLPWREVPAYCTAQVTGAFLGVAVAHVMFEKPALFFASHHDRSGLAQMVSEFVATFGLLTVIWGCSRRRPQAVPFAVGAYITAAYWFTSSTSFANPAVTLARSTTDTFSGIRPVDAPGFIVAQLLGAIAATQLFRWLVPSLPEVAPRPVACPAIPDCITAFSRRDLMKTVIFACIHNAGRSQMAAAWFNALVDPAKGRGTSAGTQPGTKVHPEVLVAMREVGIDLSAATPQRLTAELASGAALLITMGCGEECPVVPGVKRLDWPLEDPKGKPLERVREIREEIRGRVEKLLAAEDLARG